MDKMRASEVYELAWEYKISGQSKELWGVISSIHVPSQDRSINLVHWFGSLAEAREYADYVENKGGKVLSLDRYVKAGEDAQ